MTARVTSALLAAARTVPNAAYRRLVVRPGVGLCYHVVSDRARAHVRHPFKTPEQFERDLVYLKRHFRVLSYPEFSAARAAGRGPGPRDVILTFDDGFAECYSVARPLLLKHGLPCTFFVSTSALDNARLLGTLLVAMVLARMGELGGDAVRLLDGDAAVLGHGPDTAAGWQAWITGLRFKGRSPALLRAFTLLGLDEDAYLAAERPFMTTDQVRALAADGFTIGGHTYSHRLLASLGAAEMEDEVAGSCAVVRELTGEAEIPFAFPFSGVGVRIADLQAIRARHRFLGLFFGMGLRRSPPFVVDRAWADPPPPPASGRSSLPDNLRTEYAAWAVGSLASAIRPGRHAPGTL